MYRLWQKSCGKKCGNKRFPGADAQLQSGQRSRLGSSVAKPMGTIRGRAVVDFLRHRLNLAPTATYDTRDFWDRSYAKAVRAHEWGVASGALLDYPFRDASPRR